MTVLFWRKKDLKSFLWWQGLIKTKSNPVSDQWISLNHGLWSSLSWFVQKWQSARLRQHKRMSGGDIVTKQNFDLLALTNTIKSHFRLSRSPDFYIIRVSWGDETEATQGVIMYKSIMLSNREHTREVICRYETYDRFFCQISFHPMIYLKRLQFQEIYPNWPRDCNLTEIFAARWWSTGWREILMTSHSLNCSLIKVQSTIYMHRKDWLKSWCREKEEMQDGMN